jgi:hypothetical protein
MFKIFILSLFVLTSLNAKYIQIKDEEISSNQYEVLNYDIYLEKDNMSIHDIFNEIELVTNYKILDNINIPQDNIIYDSSRYKTVGGILHRILEEYNGIPYTKNLTIYLDFFDTTVIKLPMGWDIEKSIKKLKKYYPNVNFFIEGFKIKAFGDVLQINEVKNKFYYLDKVANQKQNIKVSVFSYENEYIDKKNIYIAHRNWNVEKSNKIKELNIKIGHMDDITVVIDEDVYVFQFDLQNNKIDLISVNNEKIFNKKLSLNMKNFAKAGVVVPRKTPYTFDDNSFFFVFEINKGFLN